MRLKKLKLLSQKYPLKAKKIYCELNVAFGMSPQDFYSTVDIFGNNDT